MSQFHQCLRHWDCRGISLSEGTFHVADLPFNEALGLRVLWDGSGMKPYLYVRVYHSLELKGCPLSVKNSRNVPLMVNSSIRQLMTMVVVIQDTWNRKGYFDKLSTMSRYLLLHLSMKSVPIFARVLGEHCGLLEALLVE